MPGVIAIGFLIALLLEIEIIRAFRKNLSQPGVRALSTAMVPLTLVFLTWMIVRIVDLVN